MGRIIRSVIILCLCISLAACSADKASGASDGRGSSDPVLSEAKEIMQGIAEEEIASAQKYIMLLPCDESIYGSGNKDGFYRIRKREDGAFNILFSDYGTCTEVYLCTEPNCLHNTDHCTAWIPPANAQVWPAATDDTLYLLFNAWDGLSKIEAADLDGSNRRTICTFENGRSLNPGVAYKSGSLVVMTNDVDKNTAVQSNALIEIETQTGQVDTLYQSYSSQEVAYEKGASCAFFLGITETGFLVKKITIGDSPEIQYHDVYEIPFGTDKEVPVLSYKTGEMQSAAYSGGLAYIKNNVDSYEFGYIDTQTLEQHILCPDLKKIAVPYTFDDLFVRRFIGEWAIINSMNSITVESNRDLELTYKCYAINMRTSEIKEIRLSNHYNATTRPLEVYACFDDKLLVDAQVKEEKSDDGMMNRITTTLGIISVEDYLSSIANYSLINAEK